MIATLPLELQLYVVELAAPLHEFTRRSETLKSCSLVHRSWTPTAQKLLFQQIERILDAACSQPAGDLVDAFEDRLRRQPGTAPTGLSLMVDDVCGCTLGFLASSLNVQLEILVLYCQQGFDLSDLQSFSSQSFRGA